MVSTRWLTRRHLAATAAALMLGGTVAFAHHGWGGYNSADFTLIGTVESAQLGNPHGVIKVKAEGGVWDVVLGPPANQRRAGLTDPVVPKGTAITAFGHRHLDPNKLEMKTERIRIGDRNYDIYPDRL